MSSSSDRERDSLDRKETNPPPEVVTQTAGELPAEFGRYRVIRRLGGGAMGEVYLALDTRLRREVALKTPRFARDSSGELLQRFLREAQSAAMLRHANICPVYDVGAIKGQHYIAMAYIEGQTLSQFINPERLLPERKVLGIIRKLALALQEAHSHGVVHRDLKPANIMVDSKGEPIIMDFGLAAQIAPGEESRLTQSGTVLGTPAYMSPEQLDGDLSLVGPASDQYALGVILFELLTGRLPFRGSMAAMMGQIMTAEAPAPSSIVGGIDPRIDKMCLTMLSKRLEERFQTLRDVADEAGQILREPRRGNDSPGAALQSAVVSPTKTVAPVDADAGNLQQGRADFETAATMKIQKAPAFDAKPRVSKSKDQRDKNTSGLKIAAATTVIIVLVAIAMNSGDRTQSDTPEGRSISTSTHTDDEGWGAAHRSEHDPDISPMRSNEQPSTRNQGASGESSPTREHPVVNELPSQPPAEAITAIRSERNPSNNPTPRIDEGPSFFALPADTEAAQRSQREWSEALEVSVEQVNSVEMPFLLVPPGNYEMGAWIGNNATAQTQLVSITRPFFIGRHEVTQQEWRRVMGDDSHNSYFSRQGEGSASVSGVGTNQFPVESVTWFDAIRFCNELSRIEMLDEYYRIENESESGNLVVNIRGGEKDTDCRQKRSGSTLVGPEV